MNHDEFYDDAGIEIILLMEQYIIQKKITVKQAAEHFNATTPAFWRMVETARNKKKERSGKPNIFKDFRRGLAEGLAEDYIRTRVMTPEQHQKLKQKKDML